MAWLSKLVEQYRCKEGVVDIFGVILFTDEHANVKKVLRDEDYWVSLNEISGIKWAIFSINPKPGSYRYSGGGSGAMDMMVQVWREPNENKSLLEEFGLDSTEKLPLFVVFTHIENKIVKSEMRLNDDSIDKAFKSIKEAISCVTQAVEGVSPKNEKNSVGVYAAVANQVDSHNAWKVIKKGVNFYSWVNGLCPNK